MQLRSGTAVRFGEPTGRNTYGKPILKRPKPRPLKGVSTKIISKPSSPNAHLTLTITPTTTHPTYEAKLRKRNVHFNDLDGGDDALPPDDAIEILHYLHDSRGYTFDKFEVQRFVDNVTDARNDETYKTHFIRYLLAPPARRLGRYCINVDMPLTKMKGPFAGDPSDDFPGMKPSYFESYSSKYYDKRARIHPALKGHLFPSRHKVAMPLFCAEFQAPGISLRNARLHAAHDGAAMVKAAWEVHKFLGRPAKVFFGKTQAFVVLVADRMFKLYACSAREQAEWGVM